MRIRDSAEFEFANKLSWDGWQGDDSGAREWDTCVRVCESRLKQLGAEDALTSCLDINMKAEWIKDVVAVDVDKWIAEKT